MKIYLFMSKHHQIQATRVLPETEEEHLSLDGYPDRETLCPDGVQELLDLDNDEMPEPGEYIEIEVKVL